MREGREARKEAEEGELALGHKPMIWDSHGNGSDGANELAYEWLLNQLEKGQLKKVDQITRAALCVKCSSKSVEEALLPISSET